MTTSVALVGAGAMGANHARTIADSPRSRLALVVDVDRSRARELASTYDVPWTADIGQVAGVEAAVIATPAEAHLGPTLQFLSAGIPVLVEKPASTHPGEVGRMVARARFVGAGLQVGFVERFNPVIRTALEILEVHGPVIHVTATRHSPPNPRIATSVVHDLLVHDIDLALMLTKASETRILSASLWHSRGIPEISDVTGLTDGGAVFTLSASRMNQRKIREIRVVTPTALLELDLLRRTITVYRHVAEAATLVGNGYQAQTLIDIPFVRQEGEPLALQWAAFCDLVDGLIDPADAMAAIEEPHRIAAAVEASSTCSATLGGVGA